MRRLVFFAFVLVSVSCANYRFLNVDLFSLYSGLSASVEQNKILNERKIYFSSLYLGEVRDNDKDSQFVLTVPGYIQTVDSHYQVIKGGTGCLTVNGFENTGDPVSLHVEYINESGQWLVNYMYVNLIDNQSKFFKESVCPRDME